jgi:transcriptional regulator with XRE-family HTH domain
MESNNVVAQNFARLRDGLGISQQQMADFLGVKRSLVSYYENGKREIPLDVLEKASNLFGVDLADFFEEDAAAAQATFCMAFRAQELDELSLNAISEFRKVVGNYLKMKKLQDERKALSLN